MNDELTRFKTEISFIDYAKAIGYVVDERESSKKSCVLRSASDKVTVSNEGGHDVYFNFSDTSDSGSIVDFVMRRLHLNLGQVRKELRPWLIGSQKSEVKMYRATMARPAAAEIDYIKNAAEWEQLSHYSNSYLSERGLDDDLVRAFNVRTDARRNACFVHTDVDGVTGWEIKNRAFTGFSAGGVKALATNRLDSEPTSRIVIVEASIDAISFAALEHQVGTLYVSTGGTISAKQLDLMRKLFMQYPDATVICAHDCDDGGDKFAEQVSQIANDLGLPVIRQRPKLPDNPNVKDWNDVLTADWIRCGITSFNHDVVNTIR